MRATYDIRAPGLLIEMFVGIHYGTALGSTSSSMFGLCETLGSSPATDAAFNSLKIQCSSAANVIRAVSLKHVRSESP